MKNFILQLVVISTIILGVLFNCFISVSHEPSHTALANKDNEIDINVLSEFEDCDIRAIEKELAAYDPELLKKPQVIAANKTDAIYGDENDIIKALKEEFEKDDIKVFPISAVSGKGLKELLWEVRSRKSTKQ